MKASEAAEKLEKKVIVKRNNIRNVYKFTGRWVKEDREDYSRKKKKRIMADQKK